jgi:ABC-type branched-subunit amino acid transport system ATPase component
MRPPLTASSGQSLQPSRVVSNVETVDLTETGCFRFFQNTRFAAQASIIVVVMLNREQELGVHQVVVKSRNNEGEGQSRRRSCNALGGRCQTWTTKTTKTKEKKMMIIA